MRRLLPFLALLIPAAAALAEEPTGISFSDTLVAARGGNEALLAARSETLQREEERKAARGLYFPSVSIDPLYTHLGEPILLDLNPIRDVMLKLHPQVPPSLVPSFEETLFKEDMLRIPLAARWTLFAGGRIRAANRAAEARVRDAEAQSRQTEEGVLKSAVRVYFGLRLLIEEQAVREDVLRGLERHVVDARRLEEEGLIAKVERLNAEVARAEADRQARRVAHDVRIARAALANVMAAEAASGDPTTPLFVVRELEPLGRFQEAALAVHPALSRLAAQKALASEAVAAQKGSFLPEVFAYGLLETRKADLSPIEPEWLAGVGMRFELFDGGSRLRKLAASRAQKDRVEILDRKARRDLSTLVEKQYREAEKALDQFDALDATRALAEENLRARSRAFEEGFGTSLEVVDARLAEAKVKLERLASAYGFVNALAELLEASGQGTRFEEIRTCASASKVER